MRGNGPLEGEVKVQGSKNAALPMMAAAVLHEGVTVLHNCPRIADVFEMEVILQSLGVKTAWKDHTLTMDCKKDPGERDFGGRDAHDAILNPPARQYAGEV